MKNILMIGDSWGVPAYNNKNYDEQNKNRWGDTEPEDHTQFQLEKLGYKVFNYSLNGAPNIETIEYARHSIFDIPMPTPLANTVLKKRNTYCKNPELMPVPDYRGEKIDYIVWFHTEPIRCMNFMDVLNPQLTTQFIKWSELLELAVKIEYRAFKRLYNSFKNVKTAVIGGQAPVHPALFEYHQPDFLIQDWRSEIVNQSLPPCYSLSRADYIDKLYDDQQTKLDVLNVHRTLLDAMTDRTLFFDRCHPGGKPHKELAVRLHDWFINN